jgi:hypothetical protein
MFDVINYCVQENRLNPQNLDENVTQMVDCFSRSVLFAFLSLLLVLIVIIFVSSMINSETQLLSLRPDQLCI